MMICSRCGNVIEDDAYDYYGQKVCESCYMYLLSPPKSCDPTAVATAISSRRQAGQSGAEGLTQVQRRILEIIKEKGKVTREELNAILQLPATDIERQLAVLRHCELVRGVKENNKVFLTSW
ncbi:MAG: hypothetical protein QXI12_13220 [Candidatus Methanomethyliaceae archaeon]